MVITVQQCDGCGKLHGHTIPANVEVIAYSCGHIFCSRHELERNSRGEVKCPRCRKDVYIKEIL